MKSNLAQNIRTYRKERELTQEQLAEVFGVTVGAVHKWEAGMSTPDLGIIMDIADFFDTSVDTLIGFDIRDNRVRELAARLHEMIDNRDLSGLKEAEMALKKYPHSLDIVYESALLHMAFATLFKDNKKYYKRSMELFEQALRLLPMNTNPKINDTLIYSGLANALTGLDKTGKAIEILEEHNVGGIFNPQLGLILPSVNRYDDADIYLSYGLVGHLGMMINYVIGKGLFYLHKGEYEEGKACIQMGLDLNNSFRIDDRNCCLDKTDCLYLTGLALAELKLNNKEEAAKCLKKAKKNAEKFDEAPDYDAKNLRFYTIDNSCVVYESTGDKTAIGTIDYAVDYLKDKELDTLWRSIKK